MNDDREKSLSPTALVLKSFIRNKLAVVGLCIIAAMFLFAFVGGLITPYGQTQVFNKYDRIEKIYASAAVNADFRYYNYPGQDFSPIAQAQFLKAVDTGATDFSADDVSYALERKGGGLYVISAVSKTVDARMTPVSVASKMLFDIYYSAVVIDAEFVLAAQSAYEAGETAFTVDGQNYSLGASADNSVTINDASGNPYADMTDVAVMPYLADNALSIAYKHAARAAVLAMASGVTTATFNVAGEDYQIRRSNNQFDIYSETSTILVGTHHPPDTSHWLGTDSNGMDMLTRLMYGGRVSLMIGFVVVFIEVIIGVIIGGVSGYFGGWVDNVLMRFVDIMLCIPTLPIIIIIGAVMDQLQVDPGIRIFYLMAVMGALGWVTIARIVRGQILSLREQEFMIAAEATGLSVYRRIFRHLVPNVIPQLIVFATMGLGDVIILESTLSFLGLGVKYPLASWGNIMDAVISPYNMATYLNEWIPAGFCILITVLGFNFIGDGLRDAFDPKMKR